MCCRAMPSPSAAGGRARCPRHPVCAGAAEQRSPAAPPAAASATVRRTGGGGGAQSAAEQPPKASRAARQSLDSAAAAPRRSITARGGAPRAPPPPFNAATGGGGGDEEPFTGMEVEFLGTSGGMPTRTRNTTCLGLKLSGECWLFDCGEATQHRLLASSLAHARITRIFVTHMHGDHVFGLPGIIAGISNARTSAANSGGGTGAATALTGKPLHLYGPKGLFEYVATALRLSHTVLAVPVIVHELVERRGRTGATEAAMLATEEGDEDAEGEEEEAPARGRAYSVRPQRPRPQELSSNSRVVREELLPVLPAGRVPTWREWDAHAAADAPLPLWAPVEDGAFRVYAAPLRHRVPCFGYVVEELPAAGQLQVERVRALGVPEGPAFARLKAGIPVALPGGRVVAPEEVLGRPRPGRKLVVLGDTCDSRGLRAVAEGADVLVHEATFSDDLVHLALRAGHSTAGMAGAFAAAVGARQLVLTHFSCRYAGADAANGGDGSGADAEAAELGMLTAQAAAAMGRGARAVSAAYDYMRLPLPLKSPDDWPEGAAVPSAADVSRMHGLPPGEAPDPRGEQQERRRRAREAKAAEAAAAAAAPARRRRVVQRRPQQ